MAPTTLGKYEIRDVLGRGAAGIVYDAWDPVIARRVAIKTVKLPTADDPDTQEELDRFRREAQAAGRLSHPNIVPVFDYGETNEIAYIVMEFVGGGSLQGYMKEVGQVPLPEVQRVMEQLLSGLQFSHDRGIVHRDIKPANVMLTSEREVKITDFGIARIEGSGGATMVGTMLGTPAYMSPEQWRGDAVIDARSDLYASGVMLYHMLTGKRPFDGGNQTAIMHKVLNGEFDPPSLHVPSLPRSIDAVVQKAMARAPADRFASASAFAAALKRAIADAMDDEDSDSTIARPVVPRVAPAVQPAPAKTPAVPAKTSSNMGVIVAAAVGVLVLGGGGAAWFMVGQGGKTEQPTAAVVPVQQPPAPVEPEKPAAVPQAEPAAAPQPPPVPTLSEALANVPCAAVYGETTPARASLRGVVPPDQYAAIRASFDATASQTHLWDVQALPASPYYCQVIDVLRPVLRGLGDQAGTTARLLPSPTTRSLVLVDNDPIDFDVTGPDYPSVLQVDYIDSTGKVSHYMPRRTAPAFTPRRLKPSERVRLFDTVPGAAFQVGPPPGTDLVVIIASSEPLQAKYTKDDDEPVAVYGSALKTALDAARRRGVRMSVDLVPVESREAPAK